MAALWRVDPILAIAVDDVPDQRRWPVEPTRSGQWTASVTPTNANGLPHGPAVYLHSRYDPGAEAHKFVATQIKAETYCYFVFGLGLGYHVKALFESATDGAMIVVCEPSIELIASALCSVDLRAAIESGRVIFLWTLDKSRIHQALVARQTLIMLGAKFVSHPPSQRIAAGFHAEMRTMLTDFLSYSRMAVATLMANAKITCQNIAYNLPTYVSTPPIDILSQRFVGYPAMVVSAGPSLRKNMLLLAEAKGRAVICAVQTSLKPLLAKGIRPDFVTSLDYHEMSRRFFEDVGDLSDIHLVAEPKATWHVLDRHPGLISMVESDFAHTLLGPALAARGGLKAGATVAHLAFYLARYMGCDPIIFVGQDLAFTGHLFYVPGVEIHDTWRGEINRYHTMEMKEFDRILRNRPVLRTVRDAEGTILFTDELLTTYREQFEADFEQTTARIVNASEGGAVLRGAETMPLREALDRFCGQSIPSERFSYREMSRRDGSRLSAARAEIAQRLEEVRTVYGVCDEMSGLLEELLGMIDDSSRFNRRLIRVDELREIVRRHDRAYGLINATSQLSEIQRISADLKLRGGTESGPQKTRRQIERDSASVKALGQAAKETVEILEETLRRFDQRMDDGRTPCRSPP